MNIDNREVYQLRQENMILAAEKYNMLAEITFYKNELAKICLQTGLSFPVFLQKEFAHNRSPITLMSPKAHTALKDRMAKVREEIMILSEKAIKVSSPDHTAHKREGLTEVCSGSAETMK